MYPATRMTVLRLLLLTYLCVPLLHAQKPAVDLAVLGYERWPSVQQGAGISHDGQYVHYTIRNHPVGHQTLVLQATERPWKLELRDATSTQFAEDSRRAVVRRGADSLGIVTLGRDTVEYRTQVGAFALFQRDEEEYLLYQRVDSAAGRARSELVLEALGTGRRQHFANVSGYWLSPDRRRLIVQEPGDDARVRLTWIDLPATRGTAFWHGPKPTTLVFDTEGTRLVFGTEDPDVVAGGQVLWAYTSGQARATRLADARSVGLDPDLKLEGIQRFSLDGTRLFVTLKEREYPRPSPEAVAVDVWHYRDVKLQSQQLIQDVPGSDYPFAAYVGPRTYTAMLDLRTQQLHRLQHRGEEIRLVSNGTNDDWALVTQRHGDQSEEYWNPLARPRYYLVSTRTGERKAVPVLFAHLSPGGKYLIGDDDQGNHFSYELATGVIRNITELVPVPGAGYDEPGQAQRRELSFWHHWLANDAALLLYDRYDIWQVDPRGRTAPVNLTNGYGRRHQVVLRFIDDAKSYKRGDRVLLDAFDTRTKANGFYQMIVGTGNDPVRLTMGPYVFLALFVINGERPVKARDAERYLVRRGSATESPNYFWTSDFRRFTPLSEVYPERQYNWLTAELVTFPTLDGRQEQGVLYKPEDFDSTKQYPVIVHYYETKSERLNTYPWPGFSDGNINIPYFVGRGYLVFTPDIHYRVGEVGPSALNSIVGAGKYLQTLPWVDGARIGLSGHSFGGFETNYVITHSGVFAAACADAGTVNFVSRYGRYELQTGSSLQGFIERGQNRMGGTLWQRPEVYLKNSPIFHADKVTTPVLLVSNKLDAIVHFEQGVAFFTALRRLGKRAWLLQYDGETHSVRQRKHQRDLTIRLTQFFDHYLKGAPAPVWMTRGIPARYKGIKTGLEYDTEITTPGPGLIQDTTTVTATTRPASTHEN